MLRRRVGRGEYTLRGHAYSGRFAPCGGKGGEASNYVGGEFSEFLHLHGQGSGGGANSNGRELVRVLTIPILPNGRWRGHIKCVT